MTRNYGHSENRFNAALHLQDQSLLPVERERDASGGTPEGSISGSELPDNAGPDEISTEEAAEMVDAAEVLLKEKAEYEAAEKTAWPEDLKNA